MRKEKDRNDVRNSFWIYEIDKAKWSVFARTCIIVRESVVVVRVNYVN